MSQITVQGFTPSHLLPSSQGAASLHWSILLTPTASESQVTQQPATARPIAKSFFSSQRRLTKTSNNESVSSPESALFDMHDHQLRQQAFPITTKSISSDVPNKPLTLSLRVLLATHPLPVSKLAPKLSALLQRTPTHGPEEDWLRAALDMLVGDGMLDPAQCYDADSVLAFTGEAVKEYLSLTDQEPVHEREVLDLDYTRHVRAMEQVRQLLGHTRAISQTQTRTSSTNSSQSKPRSHTTDVPVKTHKFLGFRLSPPPSAYTVRQRSAYGGVGEKRSPWERQDDPYSGLM